MATLGIEDCRQPLEGPHVVGLTFQDLLESGHGQIAVIAAAEPHRSCVKLIQ